MMAMRARAGRRFIAGVLISLTGVGCTPAQNGSVDQADPPAAVVSADSRITMQRLPCFGTCPVYTVDVAADGTVTFTGDRFVEVTGTSTGMIEPAAVAALVQSLVADGFFEMEDRYTDDAKVCGLYHTDAPRVKLTLRTEGRLKMVEHDYGCSDAPDRLREMQERVDSVAGVSRWVEAS